MNDDNSHHQKSVACYQLVQSVLKIGSALTEWVGQGDCGCVSCANSCKKTFLSPCIAGTEAVFNSDDSSQVGEP